MTWSKYSATHASASFRPRTSSTRRQSALQALRRMGAEASACARRAVRNEADHHLRTRGRVDTWTRGQVDTWTRGHERLLEPLLGRISAISRRPTCDPLMTCGFSSRCSNGMPSSAAKEERGESVPEVSNTERRPCVASGRHNNRARTSQQQSGQTSQQQSPQPSQHQRPCVARSRHNNRAARQQRRSEHNQPFARTDITYCAT